MLPCGPSDSIEKLQPVEYNLKDIMFPNKQRQIRRARGQLMLSCERKSYSVIPVIIYCAWTIAWSRVWNQRWVCHHITRSRNRRGDDEGATGCRNMASGHTGEGYCMVGNDRGDTGHKSIGKQFLLLSASRGHFTCLDQNTVYLNKPFLAKQSSSSKTHNIPFSAYLLPLQRPEPGGPSNHFPSVSHFISLFFLRITGQAWCQTRPFRLTSITPRIMFKHTYSPVINTNYHELTCTSVCVSVSSTPPEDGWI